MGDGRGSGVTCDSSIYMSLLEILETTYSNQDIIFLQEVRISRRSHKQGSLGPCSMIFILQLT